MRRRNSPQIQRKKETQPADDAYVHPTYSFGDYATGNGPATERLQ